MILAALIRKGPLSPKGVASSPRLAVEPLRKIAESRLELRTWTQGNPYRCCACGEPTGWKTGDTPFCPACGNKSANEAYCQRMLGYAAEMETRALVTADREKRAARLAVVAAIREEFR